MWEGWEVHVHCRRKRRREGGKEGRRRGMGLREEGEGKQSHLL